MTTVQSGYLSTPFIVSYIKKKIDLFNIPSIPVGLGRTVISTKLVVSEQLCNLCMSAGAAG